jgi:hypothetical protein
MCDVHLGLRRRWVANEPCSNASELAQVSHATEPEQVHFSWKACGKKKEKRGRRGWREKEGRGGGGRQKN